MSRLTTTSRLRHSDLSSSLAAVNAVEASDAINKGKYPSMTYVPAQLNTPTIPSMHGFKDVSASNRGQLMSIIEKDLDNIKYVKFCVEPTIVKITIMWKQNESKFLCYPKNSRVIRRFIVKGSKTALFKQFEITKQL